MAVSGLHQITQQLPPSVGFEVLEQGLLASPRGRLAGLLVARGRQLDQDPFPSSGGDALGAMAQPTRRQGTFETTEQAGLAIAGNRFDQGAPTGIDRRLLEDRFNRLSCLARQFGRPFLGRGHDQSSVGPALQPDPDQITRARREAGGIGVGKDLALPARLNPDVQPGRSLLGVWALECGDLGPQSCERLNQFLRWRGWRSFGLLSEPDRVPSRGKTH
jgi:hypothetical protein